MKKTLQNILLSALLLAPLSAAVDAAEISAEQIKLFQAMSPAQQEQLKRKYLKKKPGAAARDQNDPIQTPETVQPIQQRERSQLEKSAEESTDAVTLEEQKEEKKIQGKLKQFGYDLFAGEISTFAPVADIPVPADYVIGPGDTLQIFLFGKESTEHHLQVNREGELNFPGIGPIQVVGMRFEELKRSLNERIAKQLIGVRASITMSGLRSIRVFILGDVLNPGSYTVSALSTMTNALFVSGGVSKIGSLRNIQLKRRGEVITTLDLYDLLLRGDTSRDVRVQPGDVLFVPPVGQVVGVGGEVRRPALYEIKQEKTLQALLKMAGGLLPTADRESAQIERINSVGARILRDVNLYAPQTKTASLQDGDIVRIYSVLEKMEQVVELTGHVQRTGGSEWFDGMRVTDLLRSSRDLLTKADQEYLLIRREQAEQGTVEVLSTSLTAAWNAPGGAADLLLMPRDQLIVLSLDQNRSKLIDALTEQLKLEERYGHPARVVSILGNVRYPGEYPYQNGMTIRDLINASMSLLPKTDMHYALLRREQGEAKLLDVRSFSLLDVMHGRGDAPVQPGDKLIILAAEQEQEQERKKGRVELVQDLVAEMESQATLQRPAAIVSIGGLVKFPGKYPLEEGMGLQRLVDAAGGFKEAAYTLEVELTRREVDESNQQRNTSYRLLSLLDPGKQQNNGVKLQAHDHLHIRKLPQWSENQTILLEGEVRFPGEYPISQGETLARLIERAGGLTEYGYPEGALFSREALREKEREENEAMITRLERELASLTIEKLNADPTQSGAVDYVSQLLEKMRAIEPLGRLSIDLPKVMQATTLEQSWSLEVKHGDRLVIPQVPVSVTTVGELFYPSSHMYREGMTAEEYIELSGGFTQNADSKNFYIVHANGQVESGNQGAWFRTVSEGRVQAGDTIVAPLDADRMKPLTLFTNIADIAAKVATATANLIAIGSL